MIVKCRFIYSSHSSIPYSSFWFYDYLEPVRTGENDAFYFSIFCVSYPLLLLLGLPPGSPSSAQVPTPVLLPCPHPPSSTPFPDPSSVVELFHRPSRHSATSCRCSLYTHGLEQVCCGSGFGALSHTPRPPLVGHSPSSGNFYLSKSKRACPGCRTTGSLHQHHPGRTPYRLFRKYSITSTKKPLCIGGPTSVCHT